MDMKLIFIRHASTGGNLEKRYIGRTDEELCQTGRNAVKEKSFPDAAVLFSSPMRRCLETAGLIYPALTPTIVEDFRECDFGDFEGHSYSELNGRADYQSWIDSGGTLRFPNGEEPSAFKERGVKAFNSTLHMVGDKSAAYIIHGGTIMSILERYEPSRDYYKWQCKNAYGYVVRFDGESMKVTDII